MRALLTILPAFRTLQSPLSRKATAFCYLASVLVFAASFALRLWLDPYMLAGFPYVTFFPAVVICGFVFGVRQGVLVAVLAGIASWYFFIPPYFSFSLTFGAALAMSLYVFVVATDLLLIYLVTQAYGAQYQAQQENKRLAESREMMARELDHRLKNIFAAMNAIINLSVKHAASPEELARALRERLNAMGRSNLLLRGLEHPEEGTLESVILQALEPFGLIDAGRLRLGGPRITVSGQVVVVLSLIFHELGTNAAKYGALSVPDGMISIHWSEEGNSSKVPTVAIAWTETGGPPPAPGDTMAKGFGSALLTRVLSSVKGTAISEFPAEGARVRISMPISSLNDSLD